MSSHRYAGFLLLASLAALRCSAQAPPAQQLTLQQAEQLALRNHPQVQAAMNLAAAAQAQVREERSAYYPTAYGSLTGAGAETGSRIAAGALNNPVIYDRFADGITVGQLVTDFGRTQALVKSSSLHAKAEQENVAASRADVVLQADRAYFAALRTQAVLRVAQETVKDRQLVADQVSAMAKNLLKSTLDVSFANVDLAQAELLLIQAQNDVQGSYAELAAALGYADQRSFDLTDEPLPPAPAPNVADLIQQALKNRPEVIRQRLDLDSAQSYATAERDLYFPTISAIGAAGLVPFRQTQLADRYAAAGFNVNIPLFNGHLYGALHSEATARAQAEAQNVRDLEDLIVRDVRAAWLNANAGYQRLSVTEQLLNQSTLSLNLAQARYQLGLSSIIELSQAQLNQTQAEISEASAKYDYQAQVSALNFAVGVTP